MRLFAVVRAAQLSKRSQFMCQFREQRVDLCAPFGGVSAARSRTRGRLDVISIVGIMARNKRMAFLLLLIEDVGSESGWGFCLSVCSMQFAYVTGCNARECIRRGSLYAWTADFNSNRTLSQVRIIGPHGSVVIDALDCRVRQTESNIRVRTHLHVDGVFVFLLFLVLFFGQIM